FVGCEKAVRRVWPDSRGDFHLSGELLEINDSRNHRLDFVRLNLSAARQRCGSFRERRRVAAFRRQGEKSGAEKQEPGEDDERKTNLRAVGAGSIHFGGVLTKRSRKGAKNFLGANSRFIVWKRFLHDG